MSHLETWGPPQRSPFPAPSVFLRKMPRIDASGSGSRLRSLGTVGGACDNKIHVECGHGAVNRRPRSFVSFTHANTFVFIYGVDICDVMYRIVRNILPQRTLHFQSSDNAKFHRREAKPISHFLPPRSLPRPIKYVRNATLSSRQLPNT